MKHKRPQFSYVTLSLVPVLVFTGISLILFLAGHRILNHWKESQDFIVELRDSLTHSRISELESQLRAMPGIIPGSVQFLSKKQGTELLIRDLGADFSPTDELPIFDAFRFHIKAPYFVSDTVSYFTNKIKALEGIQQVYFEISNLERIQAFFQKSAWVLLGIGAILLLIVLLIMYNSLKLAMYMDRSTVKSQQLIGATVGFIRKPFLIQSLRAGMKSALWSCLIIAILGWATAEWLRYQPIWEDYLTFAMICGILFVMSCVIPALTTYFVVQKISRTPVDQLY